ncbi:hypothetical protein [Spirulina sp. 06S082]|nr:hypothetical protein [Spirulina sp. 06S082]MEA5469687.1 hypothetical protein [Spirulina sp. 06S082]
MKLQGKPSDYIKIKSDRTSHETLEKRSHCRYNGILRREIEE